MKTKRLLCPITLVYMLFVVACDSALESATVEPALITIDFEEMRLGISPDKFLISRTGEGESSTWTVENRLKENQYSKVLIQSSAESTSNHFPLIIYSELSARNLDISVKFLPISGIIDQAAGIVWRFQNARNYYVVRANALEDNVVLYKMENGIRSDLKPVGAGAAAYGREATIPVGQWSTLRLVAIGNKFAVHINNEQLFDVQDETFRAAGKVGLWTKADSVTAFDDFLIRNTDAAK